MGLPVESVSQNLIRKLLTWPGLAALSGAHGVILYQGLSAAVQRNLLGADDVDYLIKSGLVERSSDSLALTPHGRHVVNALSAWHEQHHRAWDFMRDNLPCLNQRRLLDLGCGEGFLIVHALRQGAERAVGVDCLQEMVTFSAAALSLESAERRRRGLVIYAPAESLPLKSGSFDLLTVRVAFNFFKLPRAVPEMARVLVPGGRVYMTVMTPMYYVRTMLRTFPPNSVGQGMVALANAVPTFFGLQAQRFRFLGRDSSNAALTVTALRRWFQRSGIRIVRVLRGARQTHVPFEDRKVELGTFLIVLERTRSSNSPSPAGAPGIWATDPGFA
ncbi:MAG: class I SAM-dependent methyltransferase [Phycisphaerae bacterium]|nr:class I SAM-dependent methyltransferase [Phycisphaerae bacterium]